MKHLLRTFLNDLGGNPNKKNGLNETVLHCACQLNQTKSFSAQERRAACVQLLLYWKGVPLATGGREKVDIGAQDKVKITIFTQFHIFEFLIAVSRVTTLLLKQFSA